MSDTNKANKKPNTFMNFTYYVLFLVLFIFVFNGMCSEDKAVTETAPSGDLPTQRELTRQELQLIKSAIRPVVSKYSIIINNSADTYANEVKKRILDKKSNSMEFSKEVFGLGNILSFLKYWVFSEDDKINAKVEEIWKEKMFKSEDLVSEIKEITDAYRTYVQGQLNLMESEMTIEIEKLRNSNMVPDIRIANSAVVVSGFINKEIGTSAYGIVRNSVLKIVAFNVADFVLTDLLVKFIVAKSLTLAGLSLGSTAVQVTTFMISAGIGAAVSIYLYDSAVGELSEQVSQIIDALAEEIVEKNGGIRSSMKGLAAQMLSVYDSERTDSIIRQNFNVHINNNR